MDKGICKFIAQLSCLKFSSAVISRSCYVPHTFRCRLWFQLKEKLKHYGVENVEDLTLVEDSNSTGMNRGFAFLGFSSRSDAMDAFKRLQKRDVLFGVDRPAKVSFADSFIDPGDEIMAQVNIYLTALLELWISPEAGLIVFRTLHTTAWVVVTALICNLFIE